MRIEGEWVIVGMDTEFYEDDVEQGDVKAIRGVLSSVIGHKLKRNVGIEFERAEETGNDVDLAQSKDELAPKSGKSPREWCQDPLVQKVVEKFDGEIKDLRI